MLKAFPKPYFAVIFSSVRTSQDHDAYEIMAERMIELAKGQNGFLGVESLRDDSGFGMTVSYWQSEESIKAWRLNSEHLEAQKLGLAKWYKAMTTRICKVERDYDFEYDLEK
jgi:heme-degrading monooxygenase HmoA